MGGSPALQALERSFKAVRIGAATDMRRYQALVEKQGLIEREEQFQIAIAGVAEEFFAWDTVKLKFVTNFIDASGKRDSPFDRPHFTYGASVGTSVPVGVLACVMDWDISDRNETVGATVAIGVAATDKATKFRGSLHASFQGFGQPANNFETTDVGTAGQ